MTVISPVIKRYIPPIVSLAMFMEAIDTTIINTAIPTMAKDLHVNAIDLKVALISYLLSLAIFIPISGWLADKFGIKKIFIIALGIFTVSSFFCGFSTNIWELVAWRTVQGIGGALGMPVGRLMVVRFFDRSELVQTMNRVVVPALLGPALGPLLGGFITEHFSWPWIFWVNIPFGIATMMIAHFILPEHKAENIYPLDKLGFLLFGIGLAGFTFSLSAFSEEALRLSIVQTILIVSVILLMSYIWYSRKQTNPILDNNLFKFRTFRISILGNLFGRLGFGAMPFLLPLTLQLKLNYSPLLAGSMVALIAAGAMIVKSVSKKILSYWGFKKTLIINTIIMGVIFGVFSTLNHTTPIYLIALYTLLYGIFMSLQYSSMNPLAFAEVMPKDLSGATSLHSVTIQLAQSFSVAVCAFILKKTDLDFSLTFLMMSGLTILATAIFFFLKKEDGKSLC